MAETNGKIRNKSILEYIDEEFEKLKNAGNTNSTEFTDDSISLDINGVRIRREDKPKFDAIVKLKNYLEHSAMIPESTYVIPDVRFKAPDGHTIKAFMYIPKSDAVKLADEADMFENLLGIKLPTHIYQLQTKYRDSVVPGTTDMPIPEPRLMSETNEAYEARLKAAYEEKGISVENVAGTEIRQPYTHERVDYRVNDEENNSFESEYYGYYRYREARRQINNQQQTQTQTGDTPGQNDTHDEERTTTNEHPTLNENEPQVVTESDDYDRTPLGQRIGSFLHITDSSIKSQSNHQKLKVLAALGISTAGAAALLLNPATQPVAIAAVGIGAIYATYKGIKKLTDKKLAPKIRDILFGRRREEQVQEQEHGRGQERTQQHTPTPENTQRHTDNHTDNHTHDQDEQHTQNHGGNNDGTTAGTDQQTQSQQQPPTSSPDGLTDIPVRLEAFLNAMNSEMPELRGARTAIVNLQAEIEELQLTDPNSPQLPLKHGELQHRIAEFRELLAMISQRTREMMEEMSLENQQLSNEGGHTHGNH